MRIQKITIIRTRPPSEGTVNERLQWLGGSLGLFSKRDKDRSCFRVFIELLRETKIDEGLSSDEIAERLKLTRGTVVHHLHTLEEAGMVESQNNKYYLVKGNLQSTIKEIKESVNNTLKEMEDFAEELDNFLGLKS
jgi:biotin operon repressor